MRVKDLIDLLSNCEFDDDVRVNGAEIYEISYTWSDAKEDDELFHKFVNIESVCKD